MTAGSQGMCGDPERPAHSATYEGRTLLAALGRKPSSLATQAEFPTEMLSRTRHLASAKRGGGRWRWVGGGRGGGRERRGKDEGGKRVGGRGRVELKNDG